jgi:hypothetical protein
LCAWDGDCLRDAPHPKAKINQILIYAER